MLTKVPIFLGNQFPGARQYLIRYPHSLGEHVLQKSKSTKSYESTLANRYTVYSSYTDKEH